MDWRLLLVLSAGLFAAGCVSILGISKSVQAPDLSTDVSAFLQTGCTQNGQSLDCENAPAIKAFGCNRTDVPLYAGGLTPKTPIVECEFQHARFEVDEKKLEGVNLGGGFLLLERKFIIFDNGFRLLGKKEFEQRFLPIETPDEAVSYVTETTTAYPVFNLSVPAGWRVYGDVNPTTFETAPEGFKVRMFDYDFFGCGPHDYYAVEYLVTPQGEVKQLSTRAVFANPELDGLCVD
jgi:hypothetical protein